MKFGALFAIFLLFYCSHALAQNESGSPEVLTPEALRESCYEHGAVKTVRMLTADGSQHWETLMEHIASGEQIWIAYVPLFAAGTDSGYARDLNIALAKALPQNPRAVISLEYAFVSIRGACSLPFTSPDEDFISIYSQDVIEALRELDDPYMRADKEICLMRLGNAVEAAYRRIRAR